MGPFRLEALSSVLPNCWYSPVNFSVRTVCVPKHPGVQGALVWILLYLRPGHKLLTGHRTPDTAASNYVCRGSASHGTQDNKF